MPAAVDARRTLESILGAVDYSPEQLIEIAHIRLQSAIDFQHRLTAALMRFHGALEREHQIVPRAGD